MSRNEKLHDVANQIYKNMHSKVFVPPVQSLMDIDFYKLTMGQFIHRFYPDVMVTFRLTVRDKAIQLWKYVNQDDLRRAFEYISSLSFRKTDLYYLRGMDLYDKYLFGEEYLTFLKGLHLSGWKIGRSDGVTEITFTTRWSEVTYWETIAMATLSELYYRGIMKHMSEQEVHDIYAVMDNRLQSDLLDIKAHPSIHYVDFGQRRRNSFLWHDYVVGESKRVLGSQFTGTSDTWLAFHHDLAPTGTDAHERPMVIAALAKSDEELRNSQYEVLAKWQEVYGQGLRIMLPDTFGSKQFFDNAPEFLSAWRGQRQDSGNPIEEGERYMEWCRKRGINPKEKVTIFSDGLDVNTMKNISSHFEGRHITPFGWGTLLTNNTKGVIPGNSDFRPFSMVVKVAEADGRPCVKLSNNIEKAIGPKEEIARYLRVFGGEGRTSQEVIV
jgi:nicotinate phosphoribosyltransferase